MHHATFFNMKITYLYIFKQRWSFTYKIGISKKVRHRLKQVQKDVPCYLVFCIPLFGAYEIEQWLHRRYKHLNTPIEDTDGGSEWFCFWVPFRPIAWMLLFFFAQLVFIVIILISILCITLQFF